MADHSMMKLGKKFPKIDKRTLRLARYFKVIPSPPDSYDNTGGVTDFGMMMNDSLGCCTISACGHAEQIWTISQGGEETVPDSVILQRYEDWCGYNPSNASSDQGGVEIDVLNNWRNSDLGSHKLVAYADPDPGNANHVKQSIVLFGGLYIGLALPVSAQSQDVWDVADSPDGNPGGWGGHAVYVPAYDADGLTCVTWGQLKKMTWAFWNKYCDEAHTLIGQDFFNSQNVDSSGFDITALTADLQDVTG